MHLNPLKLCWSPASHFGHVLSTLCEECRFQLSQICCLESNSIFLYDFGPSLVKWLYGHTLAGPHCVFKFLASQEIRWALENNNILECTEIKICRPSYTSKLSTPTEPDHCSIYLSFPNEQLLQQALAQINGKHLLGLSKPGNNKWCLGSYSILVCFPVVLGANLWIQFNWRIIVWKHWNIEIIVNLPEVWLLKLRDQWDYQLPQKDHLLLLQCHLLELQTLVIAHFIALIVHGFDHWWVYFHLSMCPFYLELLFVNHTVKEHSDAGSTVQLRLRRIAQKLLWWLLHCSLFALHVHPLWHRSMQLLFMQLLHHHLLLKLEDIWVWDQLMQLLSRRVNRRHLLMWLVYSRTLCCLLTCGLHVHGCVFTMCFVSALDISGRQKQVLWRRSSWMRRVMNQGLWLRRRLRFWTFQMIKNPRRPHQRRRRRR